MALRLEVFKSSVYPFLGLRNFPPDFCSRGFPNYESSCPICIMHTFTKRSPVSVRGLGQKKISRHSPYSMDLGKCTKVRRRKKKKKKTRALKWTSASPSTSTGRTSHKTIDCWPEAWVWSRILVGGGTEKVAFGWNDNNSVNDNMICIRFSNFWEGRGQCLLPPTLYPKHLTTSY